MQTIQIKIQISISEPLRSLLCARRGPSPQVVIARGGGEDFGAVNLKRHRVRRTFILPPVIHGTGYYGAYARGYSLDEY